MRISLRTLMGMLLGAIMAGSASAAEWTPPLMGSVVKVWYDAADIGTLFQDAGGSTPVTANGQTVLCWNDKSGCGNHITSTNGPTYATNTMKGNAVLAFNSAYLARSSGLSMGNITNNFAVIGVFKADTGTAGWGSWVEFGLGGNTLGDITLYIDAATRTNGPLNAMEFSYTGGTGEATDSAVVGAPPFMIMGGLNQKATPHLFSVWKDGLDQGTSAPAIQTSPSSALTSFSIGTPGWSPPKGNVAELLVLNTGTAEPLSINGRQKLEGYLAHKWWGAGSSNTLAADHPYKLLAPQAVWSGLRAFAGLTSSVTATATLLDGIVGGPNASVTLFWDTVDRGTSGWTYSNGPALKTVGQVNMDMTGLTPGTTYYYCFYTTNVAVNADGWSSVASFTMPAFGYWPLDDNAANNTVAASVGSAGTFDVNTSVASVEGILGKALNFNNQHYLTINAPGSLLTLSDFTVSAWVKGYKDANNNMVFVYSSASGNVIQYQLQGNMIAIYDNLRAYDHSDPLSWSLSVWYHIVWSQQNGATTIYRDGVQVAGPFSGLSSPLSLGATALQIGSQIGSLYPFMGAIDDVAVWPSALDATSIKAIHSLAVHTLNYNAGQAQALFNIFLEGLGSSGVVGGRTWRYAGGLTGAPGEVNNESNGYSINMAGGNGVRTTIVPTGAILMFH